MLDYIDRRPRELRAALGIYTGASARRAAASGSVLPFWLLAPRWFLRGRAARVSRRFLPDIVFGQYCLFLAIRIHDDLLDEQSRSAWLVPAGDDLLIEAEQQFAKHIESARFWAHFRLLVRRTLHSIAEVDRLQRRPGGMRASEAGLYAEGAAVFNAGVAAVCSACGRVKDYRLFERYAHHLTIAGQLLDDLEDLEVDAARGRVNVAATMLLGNHIRRADSPRSSSGVPLREALASAILRDGRGAVVFALAANHARAATRIARTLRVLPAMEYAAAVAARCAALEASTHRTRVEWLLRGR